MVDTSRGALVGIVDIVERIIGGITGGIMDVVVLLEFDQLTDGSLIQSTTGPLGVGIVGISNHSFECKSRAIRVTQWGINVGASIGK